MDNPIMDKFSMDHPPLTGIELLENYKNKPKQINDVLRDSKIHGVVRVDKIHFGIVCDTLIDPKIMADAARKFGDYVIEMVEKNV
jgi:hypothetical protein